VWWLSFALHDMAFGLLSVFLPLYVLSIGGSLLDVGLLTSLSILASVPADLFWGRVSDRVRRYKPFIALSFISLAVVLYAYLVREGHEVTDSPLCLGGRLALRP
jgi:MFS family permease